MKRFIEFLKEIDLFYLLMMWLIISSIVDVSFSASTEKGVSVAVQSKQEEKKPEPIKEIAIDDGPKADWK